MNMSDVFDLPVNASQIDVYGANSKEAISFDEIESAASFAINNHDKLVDALKSVVYCAENNTGAHPSVDCYYRALDESKDLLKELGHEI